MGSPLRSRRSREQELGLCDADDDVSMRDLHWALQDWAQIDWAVSLVPTVKKTELRPRIPNDKL